MAVFPASEFFMALASARAARIMPATCAGDLAFAMRIRYPCAVMFFLTTILPDCVVFFFVLDCDFVCVVVRLPKLLPSEFIKADDICRSSLSLIL